MERTLGAQGIKGSMTSMLCGRSTLISTKESINSIVLSLCVALLGVLCCVGCVTVWCCAFVGCVVLCCLYVLHCLGCCAVLVVLQCGAVHLLVV